MLNFVPLLQGQHVMGRYHVDLVKLELPRRAALYQAARIDQNEAGAQCLRKGNKLLDAGDKLKEAADRRRVPDKAESLGISPFKQVGSLGIKRQRDDCRRANEGLARVGVQPGHTSTLAAKHSRKVQAECGLT
jgi:hypothetical protein